MCVCVRVRVCVLPTSELVKNTPAIYHTTNPAAGLCKCPRTGCVNRFGFGEMLEEKLVAFCHSHSEKKWDFMSGYHELTLISLTRKLQLILASQDMVS